MSTAIHSASVWDGMSDPTNPYQMRARRRFRRLTDEQRSVITAGFERHRRACESLGIDPEPYWVAEAVNDMTDEREEG